MITYIAIHNRNLLICFLANDRLCFIISLTVNDFSDHHFFELTNTTQIINKGIDINRRIHRHRLMKLFITISNCESIPAVWMDQETTPTRNDTARMIRGEHMNRRHTFLLIYMID